MFIWLARLYLWLTERLYNEFTWTYDLVSWLVSLGKWDSIRKSVLEYQGGEPVLEIGFGTGELLLELGRRNIHAIGLERSPAMQRQTRNKMRHLGVWEPCVLAETQHMPFCDQSFKTIFSTFPAGYILDLLTWYEARRLLQKGGQFVVVGIGGFKTDGSSPGILGALFGLSRHSVFACFETLARQARFNPRLVASQSGSFSFPILIAEAEDSD